MYHLSQSQVLCVKVGQSRVIVALTDYVVLAVSLDILIVRLDPS